jgi:hypothetical protein
MLGERERDMACRPGPLLVERSLRDLYTPSGGAPDGRDQSLCRPSGGRGEAGIHPTEWALPRRAPARQRISFAGLMSVRDGSVALPFGGMVAAGGDALLGQEDGEDCTGPGA